MSNSGYMENQKDFLAIFTIGKIRGSGYYPFIGPLAFFFSKLRPLQKS